jgi:ferredoxin
MINHLYKAHASCVAGEATPEAYVDQAWVLFYGGGKGPIALGDKRCIQFGTCTESTANVFPSDHAGDSAVNTKILDAFLATQTAAKTTDCPTMLTQIEDIIIPQAFVPVMQGLFREAWYAILPRDIAPRAFHRRAAGCHH